MSDEDARALVHRARGQLAVILANAQMLAEQTWAEAEVREMARDTLEAARGLQAAVQQLADAALGRSG